MPDNVDRVDAQRIVSILCLRRARRDQGWCCQQESEGNARSRLENGIAPYEWRRQYAAVYPTQVGPRFASISNRPCRSHFARSRAAVLAASSSGGSKVLKRVCDPQV